MKKSTLYVFSVGMALSAVSAFGLSVELETTMQSDSVQAILKQVLENAHTDQVDGVRRTKDGAYVIEDAKTKLTCLESSPKPEPGFAAPAVQVYGCSILSK